MSVKNQRRLTPVRRLAAYRMAPGERGEEVLACYFWNVALCKAPFPALHRAEVALRNMLFGTITD